MFFFFLVFHGASERGRKELGTVRLLCFGGGGFRKVWCAKTLPPPPKKDVIYENCTAPLAIAIFKMHPPPPAPSTPSRPSLLFHPWALIS